MSTRRSVATSTTTLLVTDVWNPACEIVTAVGADGQFGDGVVAFRSGLRGALQARARIVHFHRCTRNHGAGGVRHSSQNASAEGLRRNKSRCQKQREEEKHEALAVHSSPEDRNELFERDYKLQVYIENWQCHGMHLVASDRTHAESGRLASKISCTLGRIRFRHDAGRF